MSSVYLPDEAATEAFGLELASQIDFKKNTLIYFEGEIGAGKTTLIRSMFRALGVKGPIKSPTFAVMEIYTLEKNNSDLFKPAISTDKFSIYHLDLYRLTEPEELEYLGWRDCFASPSLCCIEWPEKAKNYLPKPDRWISLKSKDDGRELTINMKNKSDDIASDTRLIL